MRELDHRRDDRDLVGDDEWVPGPFIIVPPTKDPPVTYAPPRPASRERLSRAGWAVGGAVVTLALTLLVGRFLDLAPRAPAAGARSTATAASRPQPTREAAPPPAPSIVRLGAVIVMRPSGDSAALVAQPPAVVQPGGDTALVLAVAPSAPPPEAAAPAVAPVRAVAPAPVRIPPAIVMAEAVIAAEAPAAIEPPAWPALATPVALLSNAVLAPAVRSSVAGAWYHMDARARYADSLVVVLLPNGTATAFERRWTIEGRGWHPSELRREGRWTHDASTPGYDEVCITWTEPDRGEGCAEVFERDSEARMVFGGRYWHRLACRDDAPGSSRLDLARPATDPAP